LSEKFLLHRLMKLSAKTFQMV